MELGRKQRRDSGTLKRLMNMVALASLVQLCDHYRRVGEDVFVGCSAGKSCVRSVADLVTRPYWHRSAVTTSARGSEARASRIPSFQERAVAGCL